MCLDQEKEGKEREEREISNEVLSPPVVFVFFNLNKANDVDVAK